VNKKTIFLLAIVLFAFQCTLKSQKEAAVYDIETFVYWFRIKAEIKPHPITSRPIYLIRLIDDAPRHGTVPDYEYDLWKQVKLGNCLLIGPFLDFYDAKNAMEMYRLQNQLGDKKEVDMQKFKETQFKNEYFWYFLTFKMSERKGSYLLQRIPAAVATGEIKDFMLVLSEGLGWQKLAIGPFPTQIEAEESKRLNRLEEEK